MEYYREDPQSINDDEYDEIENPDIIASEYREEVPIFGANLMGINIDDVYNTADDAEEDELLLRYVDRAPKIDLRIVEYSIILEQSYNAPIRKIKLKKPVAPEEEKNDYGMAHAMNMILE